MKSLFLSSIAVCLALAASPAKAQFDTATNNGTITITAYTGPGGAVVIPTNINGLPVVSIGTNAFAGATVTSVSIPDDVTSIGAHAFDGCQDLETINIPYSVTNVGDGALANNFLSSITVDTNSSNYSSLGGVLFNHSQTLLVAFPGGLAETYSIPNGVTRIGNYSFDGCYSITNVGIPSTVTSVGTNAFYNCSDLSVITLPGSITNIQDGAFENSDLTSVTLPASLVSIGAGAFEYTGLTSLTIPSLVTSIGAAAFEYTGLSSVSIPAGVANIGAGAFQSTSLTNVSLAAGVTNIGAGAFALCSGLTAITVATNNSYYTNVSGVLFSKSMTVLVACPGGRAGSYAIPGSVTSIADYAFGGCSSLTNITMSNTVTNIGNYSFYYCTALPNITLSTSVTSLGQHAFDSCFELTSITIPASVTSIGSYAFDYCAALTNAYFKGNAPSADDTVFANDTATAYYLSGTTGWGSSFGGIPTVELIVAPVIETTGGSFGVQSNSFSFTVSWASNTPVVVQACTNLSNAVWLPLQTNTPSNGLVYFTDRGWTNYKHRYYRAVTP